MLAVITGEFRMLGVTTGKTHMLAIITGEFRMLGVIIAEIRKLAAITGEIRMLAVPTSEICKIVVHVLSKPLSKPKVHAKGQAGRQLILSDL